MLNYLEGLACHLIAGTFFAFVFGTMLSFVTLLIFCAIIGFPFVKVAAWTYGLMYALFVLIGQTKFDSDSVEERVFTLFGGLRKNRLR